MYWCRLIPARRHPPAEGYNLLSFTSLSLKGATTHCSRLPASPGRELLPPALVYQLPLEGSSNPLTEGLTLSTTADHVSSIFKLDQKASTQPFTYQQIYFAQCFKQNSETTVTRISEITQTSEQICRNTFNLEQSLVQIPYALLFNQTRVYIYAFLKQP